MKVKISFIIVLKPILHLLGHSLACLIGFLGLALIAVIPIETISILVSQGFTELALVLHHLEYALLMVDMFLFSIVFISGIVVFIIETYAEAKSHIRQILNKE